MTVSLGRVIVQLAEPGEEIPSELIDLINRNIKPPSDVTADVVFVRAMYVVSDQVNSFGGRFPIDEHQRLADLLVDSPVMVGHRKDKLPIGRTFYAVTVQRQGAPWVKSYFYWLRSSDNADTLRANIDSGIYKECSVAFAFHLPECSICGKDIRSCEHQPFEEYERQGVKEKCHFNYRQIERVLETSLVYRGAVPDTSVTKELAGTEIDSARPEQSSADDRLTPLTDLDSLNCDTRFMVVPRYDGLPLTACARNGELLMARLDGTPFSAPGECHSPKFHLELPVYGILVGYRGKERCTQKQLNDHLSGLTSPVSRLVFNIFPNQGAPTIPRQDPQSDLSFRIIPYRLADRASLKRAAQEIMTRDGVEVWPVNEYGFGEVSSLSGYWYRPSGTHRRSAEFATVTYANDGNMTRLTISGSEVAGNPSEPRLNVFDIFHFDPADLTAGRRFVMRKAGAPRPLAAHQKVISARLEGIEKEGDGFTLRCSGALAGRYAARPIRLKGEDCYLFCRLSQATAGGMSR